MKFKTLFISFNIVLIVSSLMVFFMPLLILDGQFMLDFWKSNWYFGLVLVVLLIILNFVFISNWKTLSLLEAEDWPALAAWLEKRVFSDHHFSNRTVRMLADALLIMADFDTAERLENLLAEKRPDLLARSAARLAAIRLIGKRYDGFCEFTQKCAELKHSDRDWLLFYAAFVRRIQNNRTEAAERFGRLCSEARDPVVLALSTYLLPSVLAARADRNLDVADAALLRLTRSYTSGAFSRVLDSARGETHSAVFGTLLNELPAWFDSAKKKAATRV